jgi:FtsH-binding integral membrane protein
MGRPLQLQPIFPEPITVPGNVASVRYRDRVRFVRRVVVGHALVACGVAGLSAFGGPTNLREHVLTLVLGLAALSSVRAWFQSGPLEAALSWGCMAPVCFGLAGLARSFQAAGVPAWAWALPSVAAGAYALACGKDFSYIGQAVLGAVGCGGVLAAAVALGWIGLRESWGAMVGSAAWLAYLSYDLSMIVKRRRPGEEASAVADLFRDLLNWTTYPVRVAAHWKKHRFF